jgi:hypothetical protein
MCITMTVLDLVYVSMGLSKLAQVVILLIYICEMPGLNLGQDTDYPDRYFVAFLNPSKQML